jgi:mono/diheme cytochrome c family protein
VATATATAAPATAASAPAPSGPAAPVVPPPPDVPLPEYVTDPGPKSGIPVWMMPILLLVPLWAIVYVGAFGERTHAALTGVALGAQVYAGNCAACHGATGQGGVGPKLQGGEAKLTFPTEADHIAWVENGSASKKGQPYGDPNRPGGAHVAASGGMPAFGGRLTPAQIQAVVLYERDSL